MAPAADSQPGTTSSAPAPAASTRTSLWAKLTGNPLLTILGTATVGLLIFTLTRTENRISRLEDRMDAGFAAIDARFADQDAKINEVEQNLTVKIDALDAKIDEINLKLTALIAALNATDEIQAALDGRLLEPKTDDTEPSVPDQS